MSSTAHLTVDRERTGKGRELRDLGLLVGLTLALHVPFIGQAFNIDDPLYLDIARNVFRSPLFPLDLPYVFEGHHVTMWGHTHPPLNSYLIAGILLLWSGPPSEVVLHTAYLFFPLLATVSFYFLARRFVQYPLLATGIFACIPTLMVTAHTLMADVPLLAFWLCATALFVYGIDRSDPRLENAAVLPLTAAVFLAYQGLALVPLLGLYGFLHRRLSKRVVVLLLLPVFLVVGWQAFGYVHRGSSYAVTLFGYMGAKGVLHWANKIRNAASTLSYLGGAVLLFPFSFIAFGRRWKGLFTWLGLVVGTAGVYAVYRLAFGYSLAQKAFFVLCFAGGFVATLWVLVFFLEHGLGKERNRDAIFLSLWFLGVLFYSIVIGFVSSGRYSLPAVAPLVLLLLVATQAQLTRSGGWRTFYATLLASQLLLALAMAFSDYQFAGTYRQVARDFAHAHLSSGDSFLFSGEWGFHYYLTAIGGQAMADDTAGRPGELVVKSKACLSKKFDNELDRSLEVVDQETYRISSPVRLLDSRAKAGFWSDGWGVLPFWFSIQPLDEITVYRVGKTYKPPTETPEAPASSPR